MIDASPFDIFTVDDGIFKILLKAFFAFSHVVQNARAIPCRPQVNSGQSLRSITGRIFAVFGNALPRPIFSNMRRKNILLHG